MKDYAQIITVRGKLPEAYSFKTKKAIKTDWIMAVIGLIALFFILVK